MLFNYLSSAYSKLRKVFSVQGPYPVIRAALLARGWVERCLPSPVQRGPHCHSDEEEYGSYGNASADFTDEAISLKISHISVTHLGSLKFNKKPYIHTQKAVKCKASHSFSKVNFIPLHN